MKHSIFVDMDNTLNDINSHFVKWSQDILGRNIKVKNFKNYDMVKNIKNLNKDEQQKLKDVFSFQGFFRTIPIFPNAYEILKYLNLRYNVYIATTLWKHNRNCAAEKFFWLREHLPFIDHDNVIFIKEKSFLRGTILIDDHPDHLENFYGFSVAKDYEYNRDVDVSYRFTDWNDFLVKRIEKLIKQKETIMI